MDRRFWLERWKHGQIGFHQVGYNPHLLECWSTLALGHGDPVFVPLCGKSMDVRWLAERGHPVKGIELSTIAIETYFQEGNEEYEVAAVDELRCYRGASATIYCGDFFELTASELGDVLGVYDRGALVALPPRDRRRYADHLLRVIPEGAQLLLITLEYDQNLVSGPPFAVHPEEVDALYGERCQVTSLHCEVSEQVPPHFQAQGVNCAGESVYHIVKRE